LQLLENGTRGLLGELFPRVRVVPDVLYIDEGRVLTSAGMAAGIDLCLHVVRRDYGTEVANTIARRMVVAPQRSGGQAQYAERPVASEPGGRLEKTRGWILAHLDDALTVDTMAANARMSRRTFVRHFRAKTGTSPRVGSSISGSCVPGSSSRRRAIGWGG
jgi:transcriptional regulator GlxA family with amidase domain